jgi:DNA polymerase-3 subunit gamma/tau
MAYMVLARRWRPQLFEEVIGQEHVTRTLQNAIRSNRVAHAFLFSGPRGVGKTSVARILAKALNCVNGPTPLPCGVCDSCREITEGISLDVQEIDGASNRGVDHVRDLREGIRYRPSKGRFRIYIIDEVHMLSNPAFNALLKTLEEPPSHVVFIFATTEPHKIPATILSRCQRFDFRRLPIRAIVAQLETICALEGIQAQGEALALLAREAEGSLRDAQSLLDQVIAYSGSEVTAEAVREAVGLIERGWLFRVSRALIQRDARECLKVVEELYERGHSLPYFYQQLVDHLRNLLVARTVPEAEDLLHLPDHERMELERQAREIPEEDLQLWFEMLLGAEAQIRSSHYPRHILEMLLVKMAFLDRTEEIEGVLSRLEDLVEGEREEDRGKELPATSPEQRARRRQPTEEDWKHFLQRIGQTHPLLAKVLEQGSFMGASEDGELRVSFPSTFHVDRVNEGDQAKGLQGPCQEFFGEGFRIRAVLDEQTKGKGEEGEGRLPNHHEIQAGIRGHPLVQEALRVFEGRVVEIRLNEEKSSPRPRVGGDGGTWEEGGEGTG